MSEADEFCELITDELNKKHYECEIISTTSRDSDQTYSDLIISWLLIFF